MNQAASEILIRSGRRTLSLPVGELWEHRELAFYLAWRDIKVRYKQTLLGALWAVIQPLTLMVVFTVVFNRLNRVDTGTATPYVMWSYAGIVPWMLVAQAVAACSTSVASSANLVSKIYFPRLLLPIASLGAPVVDFAVALLVLLGMTFWFGLRPGAAILLLPAFIAMAVLTALAIGVWLAAINARYRDVRYAIPFALQVWLFASPVAYPISDVPVRWRSLYGLNPVAGVVEGFRWALLGSPMPGRTIVASTAAVFAILLSGVAYFRRVERGFADVV